MRSLRINIPVQCPKQKIDKAIKAIQTQFRDDEVSVSIHGVWPQLQFKIDVAENIQDSLDDAMQYFLALGVVIGQCIA